VKNRTMITMRTRLLPIMTSLGLYIMMAATPAQAHHAFAAQFDAKKPVTLRGTVSKVEWVNPHAWIYVDLKRNDGSVEQWSVEAASPATLVSRGFTRDFLKVGIEVTINGYQSNDGSPRANGRDLTLQNSQPLFIGAPGFGAPYDDASLSHDVEMKTLRTPQVSGAWWMNTALMQRLGITDDQKAKIERTFENHRQAILSTTDQLEKEEATLARLLDAETVDRNAVFTQIDRVTQARSEMERAGALMTLEMREYLSRAQWEQLPRTNVTIGATGLIVRPPAPPPPPVPGRRGNQ
jgi:Spy/CpxP family protein refolding chaperone